MTRDKYRVCCYSKKGSCQRKYNFKKKLTKIKVASKEVMYASYKKRILKNVSVMLEDNHSYKELLFKDKVEFVKNFNVNVLDAKNKGLIPLKFGMKKQTIKKYFNDVNNFIEEIIKLYTIKNE